MRKKTADQIRDPVPSLVYPTTIDSRDLLPPETFCRSKRTESISAWDFFQADCDCCQKERMMRAGIWRMH